MRHSHAIFSVVTLRELRAAYAESPFRHGLPHHASFSCFERRADYFTGATNNSIYTFRHDSGTGQVRIAGIRLTPDGAPFCFICACLF